MADQHERSASGTSGRSLQCSVVTPEATVLDRPATFVALPLEDGEIGIAPGHSPFIGRLGYGELRVVANGSTERFYIDAGFVQVADDEVSVLTNHAVAAEQLNSATAGEKLSSARASAANSPDTLAIRDRAELQARAQLRLAKKVGK
jgi:F-type H+-transporting ATPase subunit epsilon